MSLTGSPQHASRMAVAIVLVAIAIAFGLNGCRDTGDPIADPPSSLERTAATGDTATSTGTGATTTSVKDHASTSTTAPTAPPDPAHQAIIDAYTGYWDARLEANTGTPNPQHPALAQFATGSQFTAVVAETQKNLDEDRAFRPAPNPVNFRRVTVVSVDGDKAEVQECFVDDTQVIQRSTGTTIDESVATQSVVGTMRFVDGTWKVSGSKLVQEWEGVAGCALAS